MVYQFVEYLFAVLILSKSEECARHQFLEVVGDVAIRSEHPLKSLVENVVFIEDVGHVVHVVHQFVGHYLFLHVLTIELVGLFLLAFADHDLTLQEKRL